ncbi:MAG TPA: hypothetical protein VKS44_07255 [Candidatus Acidoferrales bacterium]|nr:hypothetical protein [Candidatus Acidoferrales bacterium]
MSDHATQQSCLGVLCQNCDETIPVPNGVLGRQIVVAEGQSDPDGRYVSTLLNLRCRACCKEHFYDVGEIISVDPSPRPFLQSTHAYPCMI